MSTSQKIEKLLGSKPHGWSAHDAALTEGHGRETDIAKIETQLHDEGVSPETVWIDLKTTLERRKKKKERAADLQREQVEAEELPVYVPGPHPLQGSGEPSKTWEAFCGSCQTAYSAPPPEWLCPNSRCKNAKTWQPDKDPRSVYCASCTNKLSFMNRHHCRSCGRIMCSQCVSDEKVMVPRLKFLYPQKVCRDCFECTQSEEHMSM
eukprot:TRINITY_DN12902_c0_g1_i2.p1 TRINITY_DN12902_c0_g1~~TRINITY_DN12902_c0_g1_i2.p1  ORF type:complete len:207 (+),score=12.98 TRINITY_DN12902_c0_g1_i2:59-679(+)